MMTRSSRRDGSHDDDREGAAAPRWRRSWPVSPRAAGAAVIALAGVVAVAVTVGGASRAATRPSWQVPDDVVGLVESAPDHLADVLAPEARDVHDLDRALPAGSVVEVRPGTWSQVGASASVIVEVTVPGAEPVPFVVVLAAADRGDGGSGDEGDAGDRDWLISGTVVLEGER